MRYGSTSKISAGRSRGLAPGARRSRRPGRLHRHGRRATTARALGHFHPRGECRRIRIAAERAREVASMAEQDRQDGVHAERFDR